MRILYLHTGRLEEWRANVIQASQMCKAMAGLGHEVVLAVNSYSLDGASAASALAAHFGWRDVPFDVRVYRGRRAFGKLRALGAAHECARLCREVPHDVVSVRNALVLPAVGRHASRVVFESHDNLCFDGMPVLESAWKRRILSLAGQPTLQLFVAISHALRDWWQGEGVPSEKLMALHDGVDPEMFCLEREPEDTRRELGLPLDQPIVLYAGSLSGDRYENIGSILQLARRHRDVLFVIVGGPMSNSARLAHEAERQGDRNVRFTGPVPYRKIPLYLNSADVLLMIWSRNVRHVQYFSPLKLFEYMAAGKTIVGHRFPTLEEVVTHGKHAWLADPDSFDELAGYVDRALNKPDPAMGAAAREKVLKEYTWAKRCSRILERLGP